MGNNPNNIYGDISAFGQHFWNLLCIRQVLGSGNTKAQNAEGASRDVLEPSGSPSLPPETLCIARKNMSVERYNLLSTFYEPVGSLLFPGITVPGMGSSSSQPSC